MWIIWQNVSWENKAMYIHQSFFLLKTLLKKLRLWVPLYIIEFDATVIQVRGLACFKTRFNPPFSTPENVCSKSGIRQLLSIWFFWAFDFAFDFGLIVLNFTQSSVFLWFYFFLIVKSSFWENTLTISSAFVRTNGMLLLSSWKLAIVKTEIVAFVLNPIYSFGIFFNF